MPSGFEPSTLPVCYLTKNGGVEPLFEAVIRTKRAESAWHDKLHSNIDGDHVRNASTYLATEQETRTHGRQAQAPDRSLSNLIKQ